MVKIPVTNSTISFLSANWTIQCVLSPLVIPENYQSLETWCKSNLTQLISIDWYNIIDWCVNGTAWWQSLFRMSNSIPPSFYFISFHFILFCFILFWLFVFFKENLQKSPNELQTGWDMRYDLRHHAAEQHTFIMQIISVRVWRLFTKEIVVLLCSRIYRL